MSACKTGEIWTRSVAFTSVNPQMTIVLVNCTTTITAAISIGRYWIKGTQDSSVLFLQLLVSLSSFQNKKVEKKSPMAPHCSQHKIQTQRQGPQTLHKRAPRPPLEPLPLPPLCAWSSQLIPSAGLGPCSFLQLRFSRPNSLLLGELRVKALRFSRHQ